MSKSLQAIGDQEALAPVRSLPPPLQRILVVDDDRDIRQFYFNVLDRSGYRVDTADDGEAGWRRLHAVRHAPESYDLLITDHSMPQLTGVELVKRLLAARMALPVIMASAGTPTNIEKLQLAAMLTKPFSPDKLVQTVQGVLHWSALAASKQIAARPIRQGEPPVGRLWNS